MERQKLTIIEDAMPSEDASEQVNFMFAGTSPEPPIMQFIRLFPTV